MRIPSHFLRRPSRPPDATGAAAAAAAAAAAPSFLLFASYVLLLCLIAFPPQVVAFHFPLRTPTPLPLLSSKRRIINPAHQYSNLPSPLRAYAMEGEGEGGEDEEETAAYLTPSPSSSSSSLSSFLLDEEDEQDYASVGSLALWEVIRELERRQVVYNVLQPREELNGLLLDARRSGKGNIDVNVDEVEGEGDDQTAAPAVAAATYAPATTTTTTTAAKTTTAVPPSSPPPPFPVVNAPRRRWQEEAPRGAAAATTPVFTSIADSLAWAGKLSEEEIRVELDFLNVQEGVAGDDTLSHSQLARLLARSVLVEERRGQTQTQTQTQGGGGSTSRSTSRSVGPSIRSEDNFEDDDEEIPMLDFVGGGRNGGGGGGGPTAKSKARQARLLAKMQQEERDAPFGRTAAGFASSPQQKGYKEEEPLLDIDQARKELAAMRDRALEAAASFAAGGEEGSSSKGGRARRRGASSSSSPSSASFSFSNKANGGGGAGAAGSNKNRKRGPYDDDFASFSDRGDVALRLFDKVTRATDYALSWATRAKGMARGAIISAAASVDEAGGGGGGEEAAQARAKALMLQKKSQTLLGPRGRRWSKLGGFMARAWAESAWQVVMASASWAGGGLLPGKYVLLGAGAFSLLLRQGLGTYMATLLVVRTCSSTLRNIMEDEETNDAVDF